MESKKGHEDVGAILLVVALGVGGLAWWWWKLGDDGRMALLWPIGHRGGYGSVPRDLVEQVAWLALHRLRDLEGMAMAFLLAGMAGLVEGNAQRRSIVLSGFGLRLLRAGRVLLLVWLVAVAVFAVAPVSLPYREVGGFLALLLLCGTFTLARGIRRVQ